MHKFTLTVTMDNKLKVHLSMMATLYDKNLVPKQALELITTVEVKQ